jgi:hypothetical protein
MFFLTYDHETVYILAFCGWQLFAVIFSLLFGSRELVHPRPGKPTHILCHSPFCWEYRSIRPVS